MALYDLNRSEINSLLKGHVSAATEHAILAALRAARRYPSGSKEIWTDEDNTKGSAKIVEPRYASFFFEESRKANVTLTHRNHLVIAAGDGTVKITDKGALRGTDTLVGGTGRETLDVTRGKNKLIAGSGRNTLQGGTGHDTMIGGGRTLMKAGHGTESMVGGAKATAHDTMIGGSGHDTMSTKAGHNLLRLGTGTASVVSGGHDTVWGGSGHDTIKIGAHGSDVFHGKGGQDSVFITSHGDDTIFGGMHTTVNLAQTNTFKETSLGGGVTKLQFGNGQTLEVKNVTVVFSNGQTQVF